MLALSTINSIFFMLFLAQSLFYFGLAKIKKGRVGQGEPETRPKASISETAKTIFHKLQT